MLERHRLGKYEDLLGIGSGGQATVYKAFDPDMNREVALKVMNQPVSSEPGYIDAVRREAEISSGLSHPNITTVYTYGIEDDRFYMALEYLPESLHERIKYQKPLPLTEVVRIIDQICTGLQYAHDRNIIHRDIKPSNILITSQNEVKLADFGIARAATSSSLATAALGTFIYMSPEQWEGTRIDRRADIYSLGIMTYQLLTGSVPFEGSPGDLYRLHRRGSLPTIPQHLNIPKAVEAVLIKSTSKNPSNRYSSASELALDLKEAMTVREPRPSPPQPPVRPPGPPKSGGSNNKRNWGIAIIVAVILIAIIWLNSIGEDSTIQEESLAVIPTSTSVAKQSKSVPAPTWTPLPSNVMANPSATATTSPRQRNTNTVPTWTPLSTNVPSGNPSRLPAIIPPSTATPRPYVYQTATATRIPISKPLQDFAGPIIDVISEMNAVIEDDFGARTTITFTITDQSSGFSSSITDYVNHIDLHINGCQILDNELTLVSHSTTTMGFSYTPGIGTNFDDTPNPNCINRTSGGFGVSLGDPFKVQIIATDLSGNQSSETYNLTIIRNTSTPTLTPTPFPSATPTPIADLVGPVITVTSDMNTSVIDDSFYGPTITFTITDQSSGFSSSISDYVNHIDLHINGCQILDNELTLVSHSTTTMGFSYTPGIGTNFDDTPNPNCINRTSGGFGVSLGDPFKVQIIATDLSGNQSIETYNLTIIRNTPTPTPTPSIAPIVLPNNQIIFHSQAANTQGPSIYAVSPDGNTIIRLTGNDESKESVWIDMGGSISPDGGKLAFSSNRGGQYMDVFIKDLNNHEIYNLTNSPENVGLPSWSPDGKQITFSSESGIRIMSIEDKNTTKLTNETTSGHPNWSPDGIKIAYDMVMAESNSPKARDIFSANINGSDKINLTMSDDNEFQPAWSPDGSEIAFVKQHIVNGSYGLQIYVMNSDGSNMTPITSVGNYEHPKWSPDGNKLTFTKGPTNTNRNKQYYQSGSTHVWEINLDGTQEKLVFNPGNFLSSQVSQWATNSTNEAATPTPIADLVGPVITVTSDMNTSVIDDSFYGPTITFTITDQSSGFSSLLTDYVNHIDLHINGCQILDNELTLVSHSTTTMGFSYTPGIGTNFDDTPNPNCINRTSGGFGVSLGDPFKVQIIATNLSGNQSTETYNLTIIRNTPTPTPTSSIASISTILISGADTKKTYALSKPQVSSSSSTTEGISTILISGADTKKTYALSRLE